MRWDTTTNIGKNLKMDDKVYKLRRRVINLIYELKKIKPDLPRITVRITEDKQDSFLYWSKKYEKKKLL